jgi:hypothetical protein
MLAENQPMREKKAETELAVGSLTSMDDQKRLEEMVVR